MYSDLYTSVIDWSEQWVNVSLVVSSVSLVKMYGPIYIKIS